MAIATIDSDDPNVTIANVNSAYTALTFAHDHDKIVDIDASLHEWSNYFKCGYRGIFEKLKFKAKKSLFILMDGTVPLVLYAA
jgi:galactokinase